MASARILCSVLLMHLSCVTDAGRELRGAKRFSGESMSVMAMQHSMLAELKTAGHSDINGRLKSFELALKPMYTALPKNSKGRLSHTVVRYALHRFFMQRHQWFVRGLDPGSDKEVNVRSATLFVNSAPVLPTILQNTLERTHSGMGLDLREVSVLAATFEDLVHREAHAMLNKSYEVLATNRSKELDLKDANLTIYTYMSMYLLGYNYTSWEAAEILAKEEIMLKTQRWKVYAEWLQNIVKRISLQDGVDIKPGIGLSYRFLERVIDAINNEFGTFTVKECSGMKEKLLSMEGRLAGRVRLSDFYNASRSTAWTFTEKIDYLRALGALDESNASNPHVIIANYITSMPQCLQATGMYSVCCPNECEGMLTKLETDIAAPEADVNKLLELVGSLTSNTVLVPRKLSDKLVHRLLDIAEYHDGRVPLHGRLFAQWMHHAFPRECPYPHNTGTTSPITADEWMSKTGEDSQASDEDMALHIRHDDTCLSSEDGDAPQLELPWSHKEELLTSSESVPPPRRSINQATANKQHQYVTTYSWANVSAAIAAVLALCMTMYRILPSKISAKLAEETRTIVSYSV